MKKVSTTLFPLHHCCLIDIDSNFGCSSIDHLLEGRRVLPDPLPHRIAAGVLSAVSDYVCDVAGADAATERGSLRLHSNQDVLDRSKLLHTYLEG